MTKIQSAPAVSCGYRLSGSPEGAQLSTPPESWSLSALRGAQSAQDPGGRFLLWLLWGLSVLWLWGSSTRRPSLLTGGPRLNSRSLSSFAIFFCGSRALPGPEVAHATAHILLQFPGLCPGLRCLDPRIGELE